MKLAVVLVSILGTLCVAKVDAILGLQAIDELVSDAVRMGAPFLKDASARLHGEIFGSGRAVRSSDVILFNKSSKDFKLKSNSCSWGGWSYGMFPEHELPSHTSSVFGIESSAFLSGVNCEVKYEATDGSYFEVEVRNPYLGENTFRKWYSTNSLTLLSTTGQGNNNQVRLIIKDKQSN